MQLQEQVRDAYFAGLFDGEGSVGIYFTGGKAPNWRGTWAVKMSINGTYRPMIEAARDHFGFGGFGAAKRQALAKLPNDTSVDLRLGRQGWRWQMTHRKEIAIVLRQMLPYLMEKREQVQIVLDFIDGKLDGEIAAKLCSEAKHFSFPAELGDEFQPRRGMHSEDCPTAKLTYAEAEKIRERVAAGERQVDIACELGVSKTQVSRIVKRQTYRRPPTYAGR